MAPRLTPTRPRPVSRRRHWRQHGWDLAEHYPDHDIRGYDSDDEMRVSVVREMWPHVMPSIRTYIREGWRLYRDGADRP